MSTIDRTIKSLSRWIAMASVSSESNAAIADAVSESLSALGFDVVQEDYRDARQQRKVNVIAKRPPRSRSAEPAGGLAYFCHTDVVPAVGWTGPGGDPFAPVLEQGRLYGRGACDMKGSMATMLAAVATIPAEDQSAPLWFIATADEEVGFQGARHLVEQSPAYREIVQSQPLALIGEPTGLAVVHAHKGILSFRIVSRGRAAHSSTRDGINATEAMVPMLDELLQVAELTRHDARYLDPRFDPPVLSWNFGIAGGSDAVNITPDRCVAWFSLRPMPGIRGDDLVARVEHRAARLGLEFQRCAGGEPFWIEPDSRCVQTMCELSGSRPMTVCYGTDGGEFQELRQRVVLGPGHIAQAHTTDEWIGVDQIERGIDLFASTVRRFCCG